MASRAATGSTRPAPLISGPRLGGRSPSRRPNAESRAGQPSPCPDIQLWRETYQVGEVLQPLGGVSPVARNPGGELLSGAQTQVRGGAKPSGNHIPHHHHDYRFVTVARNSGAGRARGFAPLQGPNFRAAVIHHMHDSNPLRPRMLRQPMVTRPRVQLISVGHPVGGVAVGALRHHPSEMQPPDDFNYSVSHSDIMRSPRPPAVPSLVPPGSPSPTCPPQPPPTRPRTPARA